MTLAARQIFREQPHPLRPKANSTFRIRYLVTCPNTNPKQVMQNQSIVKSPKATPKPISPLESVCKIYTKPTRTYGTTLAAAQTDDGLAREAATDAAQLMRLRVRLGPQVRQRLTIDGGAFHSPLSPKSFEGIRRFRGCQNTNEKPRRPARLRERQLDRTFFLTSIIQTCYKTRLFVVRVS